MDSMIYNKQTVPAEKIILAAPIQMGELLSLEVPWMTITEVLWELSWFEVNQDQFCSVTS